MRNKKLIIQTSILGLIFLCAGCGTQQRESEVGNKTFGIDDFQAVDLTGSSEEITSDPDVIGIVKELRVVNDSILAISQARSDNNVILYNLNTGQHQVANRRGTGPLELTNVGGLSVDSDGNLMIAGLFAPKVISARWAPEGDNAIAEVRLNPTDNYMKIVVGPGDNYIALSSPPHRKRMIVIDSVGQPIDSLGAFPSVTLRDSVYPSNYMFQSDIACSPLAEKVVVANKSWNEIGIHPLDGSGNDIILSGPVFPDLSIAEFGTRGGGGFTPKPLWFMFSGVSAYESGFAVGYIGVEVKSKPDFDRQVGSIIEFDWDGNPNRRFLLPSEATAFDMDHRNNTLYTIEYRQDPTLVRYKLNK